MKSKIAYLFAPAVALFAALCTLAAAQDSPPVIEGPCFRVEFEKRYGGSATCIKVDAVGKKSLLLSNNHVFAFQPFPGAPFPLADYPLTDVVVRNLEKSEEWAAEAVAGDLEGDLSFVVVGGVFSSAKFAEADAREGDAVWHKGIGSGGSTGKVLPDFGYDHPDSKFAATLRAINGDSGSGIFNGAGLMVGVTCGRFALPEKAPLRGTPISHVKVAWRRVKDKLPEALRP